MLTQVQSQQLRAYLNHLQHGFPSHLLIIPTPIHDCFKVDTTANDNLKYVEYIVVCGNLYELFSCLL